MSSDLMQAMELDLLEQAKTHLEFLGYTISPMEKEPSLLVASRPGKYTFSFYASSYTLRFLTYFAPNKADELGFLRFINSLNQNSSVTCFYQNEASTLMGYAVYHGPYTKMDFRLFYETWDYDLATALRERRDEFCKYFE